MSVKVEAQEIGSVNIKTLIYDKAAVDAIVGDPGDSSVYRYRGSVPYFDDLPVGGMSPGDVYDVGEDGMNYAWAEDSNDGHWDPLGPSLAGYVTEEYVGEALGGKYDKSGGDISGDARITGGHVLKVTNGSGDGIRAVSVTTTGFAKRTGRISHDIALPAKGGTVALQADVDAKLDADNGTTALSLSDDVPGLRVAVSDDVGHAEYRYNGIAHNPGGAAEYTLTFPEKNGILATTGDIPVKSVKVNGMALIPDSNDAVDVPVHAVVAPSANATTGQAADAKATSEQLAGKASSADATLNGRFSEWTIVYDGQQTDSLFMYWNGAGWAPRTRDIGGIPKGDATSLSLSWSGEEAPATFSASRASVDGPWVIDPPSAVYGIWFNGEGWVPFAPGSGPEEFKGGENSTELSWGNVTATREALPGYVLGSQTEKPLAGVADLAALEARVAELESRLAALENG